MITIQEFYDQLDKHDWYYQYSDKNSYYDKGEANQKRLRKLAMSSGSEYVKLMDEFQAHHFSGTIFNSTKLPKPKKPE